MAPARATKVYDRAYFDRWYRQSKHALNSPALLERKAALVIATAEYYLGRRVRNVLDVGCGEGAWRAPLLKLRPRLDYLGVDASEYAVARYGRTRNLRLLSFAQLADVRFDVEFDVIVCSDVIHYVATRDLRRGLAGVVDMLAGIAFLELFTAADALDGDKHGFIARSPRWYLSTFERAGLSACGSHCYLGPALQTAVSALELPARLR